MNLKYILLTTIFILYSKIAFNQNTYYGSNAGTAGSNNSNFGAYSGNVSTGSSNSFFGYMSGYRNTSGSYNMFLGSLSGANNTTGNKNVFIGYYSGVGNYPLTGGNNVAVGNFSSQSLTSGNNNVFVGNESGYSLSSGSGNLFLGNQSGYNETGSNKLYIDNSTTTTPLIYGDFSTDQVGINSLPVSAYKLSVGGSSYISGNLHLSGNVGIGTTNPGRALEVNGDIVLPSSTGNKQIYTYSATDTNWRIGMSDSPGFNRSITTSHVNYITYAPSTGQGFAVGVNGGESSLEILGSNHSAFFRGKIGVGTTPSDALLNVGDVFAAGGRNLQIGDDTYLSDVDVPNLLGVYGLQNSDQAGIKLGASGSTIYGLNGNLGIGTTSPGETLDINGSARVRGITQDNTLTRLLVSDANGKLFYKDSPNVLGDNLGNHIATQPIVSNAANTIDIGSSALPFKDFYFGGKIYYQGAPFISVSGDYANALENTFIGRSSGIANTTGTGNVFYGTQTGIANTSGAQNTFIGNVSGYRNTSGGKNTFIGSGTGVQNTTGVGNTFIGSSAGLNVATTTGNTFVGLNAGASAVGSDNTFIGSQATITTGTVPGSGNTTLGASTAGYISGDNNSIIGKNSGINLQTGYSNVFLGASSGFNTFNGYNNTFIGTQSGQLNNSGYNNTFVGNNSGSANSSIHDAAAIGNGATVSADFGIVIGTASNFVGIRNNAPTYPLHVQNAYTDGNTWFNASDKNLKKNFRTISNDGILQKVMSLKIDRWVYKADSAAADHIGPIAQDFNKVFGLGSNEKAISTVDEIGVALAAIQELGQKTEQLEQLIKNQQMLITTFLSGVQNDKESDTKVILYQNTPNPFKQSTEIRMDIPNEVNEAVLLIYDLQGKQLNKAIVNQRGLTTYKLEGGTLAPGMYLYTLMIDNKSVGVKRMILTE